MALPKILMTPDLAEALAVLDNARNDAFIGGVDFEVIDRLVNAVRDVDAQIVKARLAQLDQDFYPYYPEDFRPMSDALDEAAELIEGSLPEVPEEGKTA
jgi:hypothetical protein